MKDQKEIMNIIRNAEFIGYIDEKTMNWLLSAFDYGQVTYDKNLVKDKWELEWTIKVRKVVDAE